MVSCGPDNARALYLDLLKRALTNLLYEDPNVGPWVAPEFDLEKRLVGADWPRDAHTMIGMKRLDNLQRCAEDVLQRGVPGDFIETGVWRGGASIFMRAILRVYGDVQRTVWVADSFEGLPPPSPDRYPADANDPHHTVEYLKVSLETVQRNFERYGLLDSQVKFLKGWFRDTLPNAPVSRLAILRMDGDMYESTLDSLSALYPKLSVGGYLIVDDYNAVPGCREAINHYRKTHTIAEPIHSIDWTGTYWKKGSFRVFRGWFLLLRAGNSQRAAEKRR